jgi:transposase
MTQPQTYTKEFKIEAVRLLEESEKSGMEISRELGIRQIFLYKRQKEKQSMGNCAFKGPGRQTAASDGQMTQLKKENDRLRKEVEILKKPRRTLRGTLSEVRLYQSTRGCPRRDTIVRNTQFFQQRLLRLAQQKSQSAKPEKTSLGGPDKDDPFAGYADLWLSAHEC